MGGSLQSQTKDPEFATIRGTSSIFWFDPEAPHIVSSCGGGAHRSYDGGYFDQDEFTKAMLDENCTIANPAAKYLAALHQRFYIAGTN